MNVGPSYFEVNEEVRTHTHTYIHAQVRRTRHAGHCRRSKDELISDVLLWIRDVTLKTCQKRWMIGKSGERGSGISVLAARHDDDDIYIYICVCVCVISIIYVCVERRCVWAYECKEQIISFKRKTLKNQTYLLVIIFVSTDPFYKFLSEDADLIFKKGLLK